MFESRRRRSYLAGLGAMSELIFHATVRKVRQSHRHPLLAILVNMLQTILLVLAFALMFYIIGARNMGIRGDFVIYIMTGIVLSMTHIKSMGAVQGAEGPTSPMMQHAPMNTFISIVSGLLATLYIQTLAVAFILFVYDVAINPYVLREIVDPVPVMGMFLLSWFSGGAVGLVFLALKPWFPGLTGTLSTLYKRANMIASGKMFVANSLPSFMISMFDWNPLFHTIDQARGFAFINYVPRNTNWEYVVYLSLTLVMIGLMGEFYTRKHASASWSARR